MVGSSARDSVSCGLGKDVDEATREDGEGDTEQRGKRKPVGS